MIVRYGKTAHGLSKDFGVSLSEAEDVLAKWYKDRPEVQEWQRQTILTDRIYTHIDGSLSSLTRHQQS